MGGGGANALAHASSVVVDMSGAGLVCSDIADMPHQTYAPVGGVTGGKPVVSCLPSTPF